MSKSHSSPQNDTVDASATNASTGMEGLNDLSKVRELLFGQQAAELQVRIEELERSLQSLEAKHSEGNASIGESLARAEKALSTQIDQASAKLSGEISSVQVEAKASYDSLEASTSAAIESANQSLSRDLNALEKQVSEDLSQKVDRSQFAAQLRAMADAIDEAN